MCSSDLKSLLSPSTTDYKINYNYSIPNILSAIIYEKISLIDKHIANRKQIAKKYIEKLSQISGINVRYKSNQDSFFHRFIIDVDSDKKIFIKNMADRGVVCGIGVDYPLHIMYKQNYDLPNTKTASKKGFALPIRPNLTDEEIELITDAVKNILK